MLSNQNNNNIENDFEFIGNSIPSEKTVGDNNCAFNAFILALSDETVLNTLENERGIDTLNNELKLFIDTATEAFHQKAKEEPKLNWLKDVEPNWTSVKNAMLSFRAQDKDLLQRTLSSVMRNVALFSAESDFEYKATVTKLIDPAFIDFLTDELNMTFLDKARDDILKYHVFIQQKFLEQCLSLLTPADQKLYENLKDDAVTYVQLIIHYDDEFIKKAAQKNLAETTHQLTQLKEKIKNALDETQILNLTINLNTWWEETGYNSFCNEMRKPGVWAGDIELKRLARYFGINLNAIKIEGHNDSPVEIYANKPKFLKTELFEDTRIILRNRQIIEENSDDLNYFCFVSNLTSEEINKRCSAIVENKRLEELYDKGRVDDTDTDITNEIKDQLKKNNVINRELAFYKTISKQDTLDRAGELSEYIRDEFITFMNNQKRHCSTTGPSLTLINKGANHWSNYAAFLLSNDPNVSQTETNSTQVKKLELIQLSLADLRKSVNTKTRELENVGSLDEIDKKNLKDLITLSHKIYETICDLMYRKEKDQYTESEVNTFEAAFENFTKQYLTYEQNSAESESTQFLKTQEETAKKKGNYNTYSQLWKTGNGNENQDPTQTANLKPPSLG